MNRPESEVESVMNLDEEFDTYGIKQANGITEPKRVSVKQMLALGVIGSFILLWGLWPASEQSSAEELRVTAHYGNVRNVPDNSGKVISRVKKGDTVYKLAEKDGWFHVRLDSETTAWVHNCLFAPRLKVGVDLANIRQQPNGKGSIVTRLKKGDYVTKTGEQKGWYQVKLDSGKTAWAHNSIF